MCKAADEQARTRWEEASAWAARMCKRSLYAPGVRWRNVPGDTKAHTHVKTQLYLNNKESEPTVLLP